MLKQFTWQHFLVAALVFTLLWYLAVILIFYRGELLLFFKGARAKRPERLNPREPLAHRWDAGVESLADGESAEVMGRAKLPQGMERIEAGGFGFAGEGQKNERLGLIPDVLRELKEMFQQIADIDGSKKHFFSMMVTIRDSYPKMASHPQIAGVNQFIIDHAPFHLTAEEVENLWD